MDFLTTILIIVIIVNLLLSVWLLIAWKRLSQTKPFDKLETIVATLKAELISKQMEGILSLRQSLDTANQLINDRLAEGTSTLDRRMATISEIENKLGQLSIQTKNIETIGKNIQSLSELLKPPKLRGNIGEILLENLLSQILPKPLFSTQYKFNNGQRVDAVIRLAERLLPIDAKFPLESYQRILSSTDSGDGKSAKKEFSQTIKTHIDSISQKYLKPEQNTTDFAIMYIPSEAVYYQFIAGDEPDDFEYALSRKVIPSSPGHLYGFLATISAVYTETGLTENHRLLVDSINNMIESLAKLSRLNDRMNGSLRSAALNLDRSKEELSRMDYQLQKLQEPQLSTENKIKE